MQALTPRERDVLNCLARALTTKEIAISLGISEHTVSQHRKNICKKLELHSTAQLIAYAIQHLAPEPAHPVKNSTLEDDGLRPQMDPRPLKRF